MAHYRRRHERWVKAKQIVERFLGRVTSLHVELNRFVRFVRFPFLVASLVLSLLGCCVVSSVSVVSVSVVYVSVVSVGVSVAVWLFFSCLLFPALGALFVCTRRSDGSYCLFCVSVSMSVFFVCLFCLTDCLSVCLLCVSYIIE